MLQRICSFVAVFDTAGVDLQRPVVATCETALTACGLAAAAHLLGKVVAVCEAAISLTMLQRICSFVAVFDTAGVDLSLIHI